MSAVHDDKAVVALNHERRRIGQGHPRAILSDAEVDTLLDLREEGYSYDWLAKKFEVSKSCARWICTGRNRSHTVEHLVRADRPRRSEVRPPAAPPESAAGLELQRALSSWR